MEPPQETAGIGDAEELVAPELCVSRRAARADALPPSP